MPQALFLLLTAFLLFIACDDKPKTQAVSNENKDTIVMDSMFEKNKENVKSTDSVFSLEKVSDIELSKNKIIFTTKDLENATLYSPNEYPLKIIGHDGKIYNNVYEVIKLPNYKGFEIVIPLDDYGDNNLYRLRVVKSGIIMTLDKSLDITPDWSEPENYDNVYCRKTVKIYEDYTIEIYTEEKGYVNERDEKGELKYGKAQKYTKYYRINDNGDFCEVILK
jgi:hypothetical protein